MKIVAHRGASGTYLENTVGAFRAAYEMDASAIETDVRRCPECWKLKLSHDPITSEDECEKLADLADVLSFGEAMELVLEIKEKAVYKEASAITDNLRHRDKITYSSFLWTELLKLGFSGRGRNIGLLWDGAQKRLPRCIIALTGFVIGAKSIHLDFTMIRKDQSLVMYFKEKGFEVWSYTLNSEEDILLAKKLNLDAIFTDYPAYAFYLMYGKTGD